MSEISKYNEMFDYLSTPIQPSESMGVFVFGRFDPRLVKKMGELLSHDLADYFLVTGGIGKDSGHLKELGIPEANYLTAVATSPEYGIPYDMIHRETEALNGGDNARLGLAVIQKNGLPHSKLTTIAHATSLRRLGATLEFEGGKQGAGLETVYRIPTDYPFDATNPKDQAEASAELLRLADWPEKGWLAPQKDLPENLVDFARGTSLR